jgi:alcohol dehydrogenase
MWEYKQPVTILFGNGKSREIGDILKNEGLENGLLVSDPFFVKSGLADSLLHAAKGRLTAVYDRLESNPTVVDVDGCAQAIRRNGCKFVAALGGGSALDCAKAAATVCLSGDSVTKYHGTGVPLPKEHLPLIAIPTTSGTGSEVTCVAVLTDHAKGKKAPVVCENFFPSLAVIDPELTHTVPPKVTAQTGLDVLCHALEGFWSRNHQPVCDALALHAAGLVFRYLPKAFHNPKDPAAREKMSEASVIAGLAFTLPKTTASHACSFPLTNLYHIPHGEACVLTLDYFARINAPAENGRLEDFARRLGFSDVSAMADRISALKRETGLLTDLKRFRLTEKDIDALVRASHHPNLLNNPVEITDEMLYDLYRGLCR